MKSPTVEKLVWIAIYAGLVVGAFGVVVQRSDDPLGWSLVVLGAVLVVAGAAGIVVRSRMKD